MVKEDGSRVYSAAGRQPTGTLIIDVPAGARYLWLVVSGAPSEHWEHLVDYKDETDEQWPYRIKLLGTSPDEAMLK